MVSFTSIIIMLVALLIAGLFIFSIAKKIPGYISQAKEYAEHLGFENSKNAGQLWMRAIWFGLGFLITFLSVRMFFVSFILLGAVIIEAIVVFIITQKKSEHKAKKRIMYFLGSFSSLIICCVIILLLYFESKDTKTILSDFGLILLLIVASIIGNSRSELLTTGETRFIKGNITNTINYKHRFLLIPVINNFVYEYEFILDGITYKGSDGESNRQKKKHDPALSNPVEIEYSITNPQKSRLTAVKHHRKTTIVLITTFASIVMALHCIFFTDFLETLKRFFEMLTQI